MKKGRGENRGECEQRREERQGNKRIKELEYLDDNRRRKKKRREDNMGRGKVEKRGNEGK